MAQKSGKSGRGDFRIIEDVPDISPIDLEKDKISSPQEPVSLSLKYYRNQTECFSQWQSKELRKFAALIEKIRSYNSVTLKNHKPLCDKHKGKPAEKRFSKPSDLSEDLDFYELKVDSSNKARIHGVFVGSVFFVVWLDRLHAVFPERAKR